MRKEIGEFDPSHTPIDIAQLEDGLSAMGANAHKGKSGRFYEEEDTVFTSLDKFAAGVSRVGFLGVRTGKPKINEGGYPVIEDNSGTMHLVGRTIHTHRKTEFRADGVPVETMGLTSDEQDEYDEEMLG